MLYGFARLVISIFHLTMAPISFPLLPHPSLTVVHAERKISPFPEHLIYYHYQHVEMFMSLPLTLPVKFVDL